MGVSNKRGLSPIIASVLLIVVVVAIGIIIFLWLRNISGEAYEKFSGTSARNVESVCRDLSFRAGYSNGMLSVQNNGNVPIVDFLIKAIKPGTTDSFRLSEKNFAGIAKGESVDVTILDKMNEDYTEIIVIPILLAKGQTSGAQTRYVCDDSIGERKNL